MNEVGEASCFRFWQKWKKIKRLWGKEREAAPLLGVNRVAEIKQQSLHKEVRDLMTSN